MNRTFEFRVWNTKLQKFVAQATLGEIRGANVNNGLFGVTFLTDETVNETQDYEDCIIQQFTGLLDSEQNKIFEGDIIKWQPHSISPKPVIYPVVYSNSQLAFVLDSSGRHLFDHRHGDYIPMNNQQNYTIIGNIFENEIQ